MPAIKAAMAATAATRFTGAGVNAAAADRSFWLAGLWAGLCSHSETPADGFESGRHGPASISRSRDNRRTSPRADGALPCGYRDQG